MGVFDSRAIGQCERVPVGIGRVECTPNIHNVDAKVVDHRIFELRNLLNHVVNTRVSGQR